MEGMMIINMDGWGDWAQRGLTTSSKTQLAASCSFLRDTKLVLIWVCWTPGCDLFTTLYCFSICQFTWHTLIWGETWKYKLKSFNFINSPSRSKAYFYSIIVGPLPISGIFGFCSAFRTPLNTEKPNRMKAGRGQAPRLTRVPLASLVLRKGEPCCHDWKARFCMKGSPVSPMPSPCPPAASAWTWGHRLFASPLPVITCPSESV